ncbi:MAG: hypothetical protein PHD48_01280 [Alphaproteobacteria bacterium]|nr:hypothetical protein [Alphaproteobacteria bacterium]
MSKAIPTTQTQPREGQMTKKKKEYTFNLRKELHAFRTNGFKLVCTRDGKLFPMINYNEFMSDPEKAVKRWQELPNFKPAEHKPYYQKRRSAHRICYAPPLVLTS